jgi:hypothetical protein
MSSNLGFAFGKKYKKKQVFILILTLFIEYQKPKLEKYKEQKIKICLCTLGKKENRYINKKNYYIPGKSIIKGHITNIAINDIHLLNKNLKGCDGFGNLLNLSNYLIKNGDFRYYYIDHFYCKSLEEFIEKLNKGCPNNYHDINFALFRINRYFSFNKKNIHKIKYIENKTGINLSKFYI